MAEKIDRDNYCKDCKRSIYGEYKDCDVNIENNGKYVAPPNQECGCKIKEIKHDCTDEEIAKSFIEDVEAVKDQLPEPGCICCGDDRFKIIAMAKEDILKSTNIDSSPDEMAVLDNILFRCWQMGWLDGYRVKADKGEE